MIIIAFEFVLASTVGLLSFLLCVELIVGALSFSQKRRRICNLEAVKNVILIPAHNESQVIAKTIKNLEQQKLENDVIVVVADNCNDDTSSVCRALGAKVLERFSEKQKGKGYALDFGTKWILDNLEFDNLVLFDADCLFTDGSYKQLISSVIEEKLICQAVYLMKAVESEPKTKIAEFTWWLKNAVRAKGLDTLKIGCHIQGSGIAFPRKVLASINFASGSIVEDLELGLKLSIGKNRVKFAPNSTVISHFPASNEGLSEQRKRWEHGHMDTITKSPTFFISAFNSKSFRAVFLILDAVIPPLFAYLIILISLLITGYILQFFGYTVLWLSMLSNNLFVLLSLTIVWLIKGRTVLKPTDIPKIFSFILDKIGVYSSFAKGRQTTWVRTSREDEKDEKNKD
ncbi:glycosyltransferase family 2 protein [Glaciecola petra]|uniref:Glycosyltransferase family 2 protein n=1 Tax=Glaciecola petra TaxID=3075602 RepID=A0ABU2ZTH2_9ALTE|nr:glycosyltransferase family 2 protein [Aestuariibacter sp. P117]MDT0595950.1 glycosyltransferase family 2 protein [Aestuariibacter sp. P117]